MPVIAARIQSWTRDLSMRRVERYGPILAPELQELISRDPRTLGAGGMLALLAAALHVRPLRYLRTGPWRELVARWTDRDTPQRRVLVRDLAQALAGRLSPGARILTDYSLRRQYARDLGDVPPLLGRVLFRTVPLVVVQPASTEDVCEAIACARDHRQPIVPRGVASWGFGGAVPTRNGIVIDMSPMDAIGEPDLRRRAIVVEGGAKWGHIDRRLEQVGLGLMCYPSSRFSTVAGWVATGGWGLTAFGYGHLKNAINWVELVTPSGRMMRIGRDDAAFDILFGSEGQLGLITRVELRVLARPAASFPHLIYGTSRDDLFAFVGDLAASGIDVTMVKFYDRGLMWCFNDLYRRHAVAGNGRIVEIEDAVLVQIDGREAEEGFCRFLARQLAGERAGRLREAPEHVARYLWHDRFNPLKIQLVGPSLLAGELVIGAARAGRYIDAVKELGRQFKLEVLVESHFLRQGDGELELLLIPMFHSDRRRRVLHFHHVTLVPVLTRLGVRMGGRPYGIGIWNTPFLRHRHPPAHLARLERAKRDLDPEGILNPGKFWRIRSRFWGVPGLLFRPRVFSAAMDLALATHRLRGWLVGRRASYRGHTAHGEVSLQQLALECTHCGNCVAVCPAYQVTKDERTTARLKLRLGERLLAGGTVDQDEADQTWICTRCGECERVCQTELPLLAAYDAIEARLEPRFGRPDEEIQRFVSGLGTNPDYLELIESEPFRSA